MNPLTALANAATRRMDRMFPGFFSAAKHNVYADFGYPETLSFKQFYDAYTRSGIAQAGVNKTILKTWQDAPFLLEYERDGSETKGEKPEETKLEKDIRLRFAELRLWQRLAEADRRSLVGCYSGAILRLADSKRFMEPVDTVPGGLAGLVEVIPAWEGQLEVSEWDTDEQSETYGQPKMFQFSEASFDTTKKQPRQFQVHPDRVLIWSEDGTVHGRSMLEAGYNALLTIEKIIGAGGEGFWKNAKSGLILEVDATANIESMAKAMGVPVSEVVDLMNEQVEDWQKGFDKQLLLQGMKANTPQITLPSPEHFFAIALQEFAASVPIPMKILVGSQTGERASTEDAQEWAQTNMSRRNGRVIPNTMALVARLVRFGILPEKDWHLDWTDLTETSMSEKIDRAVKMADTNQKMKDSGEIVFTHEEIRAAVNLEPLSDAEKYRDDVEDDEAALGEPTSKGDPDDE